MNTARNVPVFRPLIQQGEYQAAHAALELGWLGMGSYVKSFEDAVASVCGLPPDGERRAVAVSTGHAALHLAMMMMGISPGDEVITPAFNNAADFQAIRACGADPVFVDVLDETLCVDPEAIEAAIGPRTRCIIAMDYDIHLCEHDRIAEVAARHGLPVLHDAAHSFGSAYRGRGIGRQHPYTIFSFDPVKTVTCIDGGALLVDGAENVRRLQAMRLIGMTQPAEQMYGNARAWTYDIEGLGFRYHMANLHAAIGLSQIAKLDLIRESRRAVCRRYHEALRDLPWLVAPRGQLEDVNPFLYYVRVRDGRRDAFRAHLKARGVDTGIHWQAGHSFSWFADCRRGDLRITERVVEEICSLPLHSQMAADDLDHVIDSIRSFH